MQGPWHLSVVELAQAGPGVGQLVVGGPVVAAVAQPLVEVELLVVQLDQDETEKVLLLGDFLAQLGRVGVYYPLGLPGVLALGLCEPLQER